MRPFVFLRNQSLIFGLLGLIGLFFVDNASSQEQRRERNRRRDRREDSAKLEESATSEVRGTVPAEKVPEGAITVISFGAEVSAKPADEIAPTSKELPLNGDSALNDDAKLTFNFRYTPWADVLKLFAEVNDLSLDLTDIPSGTFNYKDEKQHTMTEALDVINGYLLGHGYVLVRRDRFLVCLNIEPGNPIPPNVVPDVTTEELQKRGKNELLRVVLPLDGLDPDKIASEVEVLLGPLGKASSLKNSNSLVLTGIGSNLRRVTHLLSMNNPIYGRDTAFKAIPLKHISADAAERTVRRLFNLNPNLTATPQPAVATGGAPGGFPGRGGGPGGWGGRGGGQGGGDQGGGAPPGGNQPNPAAPPVPATPNPSANQYAGKIQVTADTHTKHLLVVAEGKYLKVVEDVVMSLDRDTDALGNPVDTKENPSYLEAYSVTGGDTAAISRMLNNVVPGVVVGDDPRAQKLYVQGTKDDHEQVRKILSKNSSVSSEIAVIELLTLDPSWVMQKLNSLYSSDTSRAPSIVADPSGRRIVIRGTSEQLLQVKTMLREMGESSISLSLDESDQPAAKDRGTSRKINLGNRDADVILKLVKETWDASGRSPIRIVNLPKPSPIKDRGIPGSPSMTPESNTRDSERQIEPKRESTKPEVRKTPESEPAIRQSEPRRDSLKPRDERPRNRRTRPETTQIYPRPVPNVQLTKATAEETEPHVALEPVQEAPSNLPRDAFAIAAPAIETEKSVASEPLETPVGVTVTGNSLILTSKDTELLDQLEEIIAAFISVMPHRTEWSVRYLRTADASECATMIEKLFPQNSSNTAPAANDNLFNPFSFRSMMNTTTSSQNQTPADSQSLRIITDVRANALFITGPADLIRDIDQVLAVLDSNDIPGTTRERLPRAIPVEFADVDDVADVIGDVFKDLMTAEQPQQGQPQQPQMFNPFNPFMGASRAGGTGATPARKPPVELTLGVDKRTNHLIVSCNETLFRRVETMVKELDQRAKESRPTVRLVELKTADPLVVQSTLTSLMPRVTVSATRSRRAKKGTETSGTPGQPPVPDAQANPQNNNSNSGWQGGGGRNQNPTGSGRGNNGNRRGAN